MFDQLIRARVVVPEWKGQAHKHLKLTAFDEPEDDLPEEEQILPQLGRPWGGWKKPTHKVCNLCGKTLPLTGEYFHVAKRSRTWLMSECKVCHNKRQKARRTDKEKQRVFYNQQACRVTWPDGRVESFRSVAMASKATGTGKKTISFRCRKQQLGKDGSKWEYI